MTSRETTGYYLAWVFPNVGLSIQVLNGKSGGGHGEEHDNYVVPRVEFRAWAYWYMRGSEGE